ncbi:MAG: GNAT family N-acetyltransferase, partial [Xanthobacteraceae bacterium]|nr:GNAT family N-acetyltransferase [Xanthobacteraceae bacterium]
PSGRLRAKTDARIARIEVLCNLAAAESPWKRLTETGALTSPYQRFEWASHWFRHVGRARGASPLIVVGADVVDAPYFLLPLVLERRHGARIATYFGGSHSNLNMPVFTPILAAELTPDRLNRVLRDIAAAHGVDLFALTGQPPLWQGVGNPFAALPFQRSADDVYFGTLCPDEPMPRLPSGMRKKERQLQRLPGFRYCVASSAAEVDRILAFFRAHKAARFGAQGIHNVFEDRGVMNFIADACHDGLAAGRPVIELHALEAGGDVLAIIGGVQDGTRFSVMFNSITTSPLARKSPGIILTSHVIARCAERGLTSFDLGAGRADFKTLFCTGAELRFDCYVPCSLLGHIMAAALRASNVVKRPLKTSDTLMNAISAIRRLAQA